MVCAMNIAHQPRGASRREFIRNGLRYALLTGVAAVSGILFKRSGGKLTGQSCLNKGICSRCIAFSACGLPPALSARRAKYGESS